MDDDTLRALPDNELAELRSRVLGELERRANLASIPAQIRGLADEYVSGGGDIADLSLTSEETP